MKWPRALAAAAALAAISAPLPAQERPSSPEYRQVNDALMCQCGGCNATVSHCAMEHCHSAEPIREEVAERLEKGESPESVIQAFTDRYGIAILSAPPVEGFHLTAWIAPFVVLIAGFFVTRHVLRSWRRQTTSSGAVEVLPLSEAQRARIEKELRELSS